MDRFLTDLSAWARSSHADAAGRWERLLDSDQLICHPVFAIECLHTAVSPEDYEALRGDLEQAFAWLRPDGETAAIAMRLQRRMATAAACGQRVKTADLLIAALAVQNDIGVLHYDRDYDLIREYGEPSLRSEWLAPRGSLETTEALGNSRRRAYRKAFGERMIQLQDDADLEIWPKLIDWIDAELEARSLAVPPTPAP